MKNLPNFNVVMNGASGEIFVSDNHEGRFMCVFVKTDQTDFCSIYDAYGFMVWTPNGTNTAIEFFPIKLKDATKLTHSVMQEMWEQISRQIKPRG
jgi:hypothetical protein